MKKAIIIGASSGLGREISKQLLAEGWSVGVAARRTEKLEEIRQMAPERVMFETINVISKEATAHLNRLIERMGGMNLYVHASGIGRQNAELKEETEMQTVETNGMGFTRMVGEAFRYMAEQGGGHIAVISSVAGTKGIGITPSYSATKAFQSTYVQALEQLSISRGLNISFTDIRPGFVDTDILDKTQRHAMLMKTEDVARSIVRAIRQQKHVCIIDWRWHMVVAVWRSIPRWVWRRMKVKTKPKKGWDNTQS